MARTSKDKRNAAAEYLPQEPELRRHMGARLRTLRSRRGLTVSEVGGATGLSPSFVSLVEKGDTGIEVSRLLRLADFYGVWIGDLFGNLDEAVEVVRDRDTRRPVSRSPGAELRILSTTSARAVQPFTLRLRPSASFDGLPHAGDQFTHCISGVCELGIGTSTYRLSPGDTVFFPGRLAHSYRNDADEDAFLVGAVVRSHL